MIHPFLALKAHTQTLVLRNFEYTPYGKYMKKIHNIHLGESCFIIGNGPSLTADDLNILQEKKIDTFAVNRIYKIFSKTRWRPTYYVNTDAVLIRDILGDIDNIEAKEKFVPLQNKYYQGIDLKHVRYFFRNDLREKDQKEGFALDCSKQVNMRGTVTIDCMQLAIHMGYRYIYLLGVDHNFDKIITDEGEVVINTGVKNYFVEDYDTDVSNEVTHNLGNTTKAYSDIGVFCERHGVKVYNATRKTKLDVFEKVGFEEAINEILEKRNNKAKSCEEK